VLAKLGLLRGRAGVHRPDDPALGHRCRRRRPRAAFLRRPATSPPPADACRPNTSPRG
jgi:hypothetical protein